ncbi:acyl-CoA dehydrogenase family protein [Streptomyces sp. NPDC048297]|uniref:acyl-CoA dehydrogenase family protein n=1 Tax=Streptomyces sp. NPDC048297 TaxID=3365531 RepID=UPI0037132477
MDTRLTAEQEGIRRTLRELLSRRCGAEEVRAAVESPGGHDPALWSALAGRLGLPGLALPEEYGGAGCSVTELALACEEMGRALAPTPLTATSVLAAPLLLALGTDAQRADLLPRIAAGTLTATLAVPGPALTTTLALTGDNDGEWAGGGRAGGVQARQTEDGWRLYGQVDQVLDGHSAGLLVVAAHTGGFARSRILLFLVAGDAPGVVRRRRTALDSTRGQGCVQLREVGAEVLGAGAGAGAGSGRTDSLSALAALAALGDTVAAVLAAEAVGAAERVLERTVEYVGQREQFGRPIGSFQAVKHRLADVYVAVQAARSAAYYAAWEASCRGASASPSPSGVLPPAPPTRRSSPGAGGPRDATPPSASPGPAPSPAPTPLERRRGEGADGIRQGEAHAERSGGLALAQALETLRLAAGEAIQLHGGIGFTWEHEAHLYFKRAARDELLFGPVHRLRDRAAERSGLFARGEVAV